MLVLFRMKLCILMWSQTKPYGWLTSYVTQLMILLLVLQVHVIYFVLGTSQVRLSHPLDLVMGFHMLFLSLDRSQNDLCLTAFFNECKRVFHVSILSLLCSRNVFASGHISYRQASTYHPHHTYYVNILVFFSVRTYHMILYELPNRLLPLEI